MPERLRRAAAASAIESLPPPPDEIAHEACDLAERVARVEDARDADLRQRRDVGGLNRPADEHVALEPGLAQLKHELRHEEMVVGERRDADDVRVLLNS